MPKYPNEKQIEKYIILVDKLTNEQIKLLVFASTPKSNSELQEDGLGLQKHTDNFKKYIDPLLVNGALERTFPDSPNSPSQKYFTSNKGKIMLYILSVKFKN
jgi:ATP-dependent DNA helicase RecG